MNEHHHRHHEELTKNLVQDKNALIMTLALTATFMLVEFAGGYFSNSLALVSDAGHMLTDAMALGFSLMAIMFIASQQATAKKTYGFYRLEILAALLNGSLLVLLALFLFSQSYHRLLNPQSIKSEILLGVASLGLLANIISILFLLRSGQRGLNVRAALWHVAADTFSSLGVLVAGAVIYFTKWYIVDPLVGAVIGLFILRGAIGLVSESVDILLEATPKEIDLDDVVKAVRGFEGVRDFHDVHIWTITSGFFALSGHLLVEDSLISEASDILDRTKQLLRDKFKIEHATIQVECEACDTALEFKTQ